MKKLLGNQKLRTLLIIVVAILVMAITNHEKTFWGNNQTIKDLYWNSEYLVYDTMTMSYQPGYEYSYGLGTMYPTNQSHAYLLTDEERGFYKGYSVNEKVIAVRDSEIARKIYAEGHIMIFFSGDKAKILNAYSMDDGYWYVEYEAEQILSHVMQDSIKYICLYNEETGTYRQVGNLEQYESQIGLQGMLFSAFPKEYTVNQMIIVYRWILALLYATVITLICYLIYKKYDLLLGTVFYVVTLLSPWMIGYSTNLYWVEFTWFLPMMAGLICANNIQSRKHRIFSYIVVMFSIAIKCACGYEFITTIMLSAIVFLLVDFTIAIIERKDKKEILHLFKTIFNMGIFALVGFAVAIIIHAYIRGEGDISGGLRAIYYNDVLRRTIGGNAEMFQGEYAASLKANVIIVVLRYLLFKTPIIWGVPGFLFIPLIAISFLGLVYGIRKKVLDKKILVLYIWTGITTVSWFVLGKSHSYVHTFMNFVLWYFGYIQVMFYSLVRIGKVFIEQKAKK